MANTALALSTDNALPAIYADMGGIGNENMDGNTLAPPRLYLLQQLSPQVTKGKPEFIPGASAGQFLNSLTGEVMDSLYVANLFMQRGFAAFKKREFGVKDFQGNHSSIDAAVAHIRGKGLNPADYDIEEDHTHTLAIIDADTGTVKTPILYSMKRSGLSVSRSWNAQIVTLNADVPRFASVWMMESSLINGAKGSYYVPKVGFAGWAQEQLARDLHDLFKGLHGQQPLPQDDGSF